jgi:hypothetical protein
MLNFAHKFLGFQWRACKCMVANIRAAKEIRMHGYLRCNPSYTNAIGVEIVTTQM